jgi:uncharacterized protein (TIGR03437 family)
VKQTRLALTVLLAGTAWAAGPSYSAASIVNASNYTAGPFAANSILSIFGTGLARSAQPANQGSILPLELNYTRVIVQGQPVPLLFVSENQINFLISPVQKAGPVTVVVVTEGLSGPEVTVTLVNCAPALLPAAGGYALAVGADNKLLTADTQARAGDIVVIYLTGLGRTTPSFDPGEVPYRAAAILANLKVTLGTLSVDPIYIKYAGVTPGWVGLYQLNLEIPKDTGTDPQLQVTGDVSSSPLKLAIR